MMILAIIASISLYSITPIYGQPFGWCSGPTLWNGCSIIPDLIRGTLSMIPLVIVSSQFPKLPWVGLTLLCVFSLFGGFEGLIEGNHKSIASISEIFRYFSEGYPVPLGAAIVLIIWMILDRRRSDET